MNLRQRMLAGEKLAGTFLKTPAYELIEILAQSDLDFVCLDAEHAPFDRARMDACLAMGRALNFPVLVRVGGGTPELILQALDSGAVGLVIPHVDSVEKAQEVARHARFGLGGRGFAGSTRWAGFATRPMPDIIAQSASETLILVQIEEPAGVEAAGEIAAVEGVDGVFIGPADLSVGYGRDHTGGPELEAAMASVGEAARSAGKAYVTWVPDSNRAREIAHHGFTTFVIGSEQGWMRSGASAAARVVHDL